jgi:GntR family histidine utilization transcriptional repressor
MKDETSKNDRPAEAAPASLHQRILADVEQRILSGAWPPGHRIPSEHELTEHYGCSRMTVNKVLTQLARAGLIERRRKAGSFVAQSRGGSAILEIHEIKAEVEALGLPYRFDLRERTTRRSQRGDRERLRLGGPQPVLLLQCVHFGGDRPYCVEDRIINLQAVPAAVDEAFEEQSPGAWLFNHVPWTSAEHRIRAEGAEPEIAAALKLRRGAPCLVIERRTWANALAVTQVRLTYPAEARELVARFSPSQA